jgi:vacuolar-type H+-ATPase subunit H
LSQIKNKTLKEVNQMAKEVWEEIQATESAARQLIDDAKSAAAVTLKNARQKATELIRTAETQAREAGEHLVNEKTAAATAARQARLQAIEETVQQLSTAGTQRLPGAVQMITEKVVS